MEGHDTEQLKQTKKDHNVPISRIPIAVFSVFCVLEGHNTEQLDWKHEQGACLKIIISNNWAEITRLQEIIM